MCGAYFLQQSPALRDRFGIISPEDLSDFVLHGDAKDPLSLFDGVEKTVLAVFRPTDEVPVLARDRQGQWVGFMATWWLAMNRDGNDWTPNQKLATFNSRIDKVVGAGRSIHRVPPRSFRVVVPASGFVEWHNKSPHLFTRSDGKALRLGGMAKAYQTPGGYHYAVSIVTLPGHAKTRHIHEKSIPLILSDRLTDTWLDRAVPHADFGYLQNPLIPTDLQIMPVVNLHTMLPAGECEAVAAD